VALTARIGTADAKFTNLWFGGTGTSAPQGNTVTVSRVSHAAVEAPYLPTSTDARVTQGAVETVYLPTDVGTRVSQLTTDVLFTRDDGATRLSQLVVEALLPVTVPARMSQIVAELTDGGNRALWMSQEVIELLGRFPSYCGDPSLGATSLCGKPHVVAWMEWTVERRES